MIPYKRSQRLKKLLQEEISNVLKDFKDPRVELVTVTDVIVSDDLKKATVYFSTLKKEVPSELEKILNNATGYIRRELNKVLFLKRIPELIFKYDFSIERASKISEILDKISREKK